jgi:aspartyl-tRNA synthetase
MKTTKKLRSEYVAGFQGRVERRPDNMENKNLSTGEVELVAEDIDLMSIAQTPPFQISGKISSSEDLRLKYRYLDLRNRNMQRNLMIRHQTAQLVRNYFSENGFIEIETPFLMKSTPEGARDFLVPSRVWNGRFYALPQSPQTYKQLLMMSGFDRYFQIVRCFRDEDLRADRQRNSPKSTLKCHLSTKRIFLPLSTVGTENFCRDHRCPVELAPFNASAMKSDDELRSDKPDLRFGAKIHNLSALAKESIFKFFAKLSKAGAGCRHLCKRLAAYSRKQIDSLTEQAKVSAPKVGRHKNQGQRLGKHPEQILWRCATSGHYWRIGSK